MTPTTYRHHGRADRVIRAAPPGAGKRVCGEAA